MAKSRSFSIFLLKEGYDSTNALREDHTLDDGIGAQGLPKGATLFVLDNEPRPPWWRSYFGVEKNLTQVTKGALVFLPVSDRCFVLSFGHVAQPCDLLAIRDSIATFYHVKVSTLSAQLSHLFNQGVNAIELMRLEAEAVDKLEALIRDALAVGDADRMVTLVRDRKYRIVFGIVTRKDPAGRSLNLPLFSRISLMRGMKALQLMDVPGRVMFIADQVVAAEGRKKKKIKSGKPPEAGVPDVEAAE